MRWRLMVYLGAYGPMRSEEPAGLRRRDVGIANLRIRIRLAEPEWMNGRRVEGDTRSEAGTRTVILPAFLRRELRWHLESYAEPGPDGLLFVGRRGAPFRRSTFGRKWRRAREVVGMPEGFRFHDLRHTLSTRSGATLKDTMVRAGQSSEKAALIYQHSDEERQEEVAAGLDATVRKARAAAAREAAEEPSGTDLARGERSPGTAERPGSPTWAFFMERVTGIELALSAWEATALGRAAWLWPAQIPGARSGRAGRIAPLSTVVFRLYGYAEGTEPREGRGRRC
ncbi:tyrosine-type recombinase/integrase [Streptomyces hirsutus]